jgi:hypothetical protein
MRGRSRDTDRSVRNLTSVAVLGLAVVYLVSACGSEDDKKKDQGPKYNAGGDDTAAGGGSMKPDAGADSTSGGTSPDGGTSGTEGGTPNTEGGTASTEGGTSNPDGGTTMTGDAGSTGDGCEPGTRECDDDPSTVCEQDITIITACGDCTTKCAATNGVPMCVEGKCQFTCSDGFADCDGKGENGCEVALATDPKHCGTCERNCAVNGATCGAGACSTVALQQNATTDTFGAWAFSPLGLLNIGTYNYAIRRFTLDTPGALTIWTTTQKTAPAQSLLVIDDDVYWSERGANSAKYQGVIYKKAITAAAGTLPTPVFSPEFVASFLRRSGNALYWATGGYQDDGGLPGGGGFIYTRAIDAEESDAGTKIVTVDQGNFGNIRQLGVTSNALYWVTDQAGTGTAYELRTAPLAGSPISVVPAVFPNASLAITAYPFDSFKTWLVAQGQYVYFNRIANDAQDGVYRYKTGLAKPERIVLASYVTSLVVDADYVYFVQHNVQGAWRAPINDGAGGAAEKITDGYVSKVLAVDDTFVYIDNQDGTADTDIYKVIK